MKVAIIGGGLSGIVSLKNCIEEGLDPTCFELTNKCGGLWSDKDAEYRGKDGIAEHYTSLITNTSKEVMTFSDFPMPASYPSYITPRQVEDHILNYIDHFQLRPRIRLRHRVVNINKTRDHSTTGCWNVTVVNEEMGEEITDIYDAVMVCTGVYGYPYMPNVPGIHDYSGTIIHSKQYRDNSQFKDQSVLVVGNGPSGCDIAAEICENTDKEVYLASNRGVWITTRNYKKPSDLSLSLFMLSLAKRWPSLINYYLKVKLSGDFNLDKYNLIPRESTFIEQQLALNDTIHQMLQSQQIKVVSGVKSFSKYGVNLKSGDNISVNSIVLATGFDLKIPYLDPQVFDQKAWNLYKHVWPVDLDTNTLAVVGYIKAKGPPLPSVELQSRWAVKVFKGERTLPSKDTMLESCISSSRLKNRITIYPTTYCWEIARIIGCAPSLGLWDFLTRPLFWCKLVFGPCVPYIFRLVGPGSWDGAYSALYTSLQRYEIGNQLTSQD